MQLECRPRADLEPSRLLRGASSLDPPPETDCKLLVLLEISGIEPGRPVPPPQAADRLDARGLLAVSPGAGVPKLLHPCNSGLPSGHCLSLAPDHCCRYLDTMIEYRHTWAGLLLDTDVWHALGACPVPSAASERPSAAVRRCTSTSAPSAAPRSGWSSSTARLTAFTWRPPGHTRLRRPGGSRKPTWPP